jgi:hypothetical protein
MTELSNGGRCMTARRIAGPYGGRMKAKPADKYTADRFRWLDQIGADADLTPLCFRVAYVISTFVNRASGDAWPGQDRLAEICHATDRGIRAALTQLKNGGHLQQTGRGGRSITSRYKPVLKDTETRNPASTFMELNPEAGFLDKPPKPGTNRHKTRNRSTDKPGTRLPTIPLIEPIEEPFERKSPQEFEIWWSAYPKKDGEIPARKIYARIIKKREASHAELLAGAMRYAAQRTNEDPKFTKEPKNWLAEGRWRDQTSPASQHRKSETPSRADSALDGMRSYLEDHDHE